MISLFPSFRLDSDDTRSQLASTYMAGPRPTRPNNTHSQTHTLAPITRRQADLDLSDLSEKERDLLYDDHLGHVQLASFRLQDQIGIEDDVPRSFTNLTHFLEHPTGRFEDDVDADAVHDLSGDRRDDGFSRKSSDKMESPHPSTGTELKDWYVIERENVVESVGFNSKAKTTYEHYSVLTMRQAITHTTSPQPSSDSMPPLHMELKM